MSYLGHLVESYRPRTQAAVVVYPCVPTAGLLVEQEPFNPLVYLILVVDMPFSVVMDTILLPYDLHHTYDPLPPASATREPAASSRPVTR